MSIPMKKYVDITSGVGAGASVKERELILRLFTTSAAVPAGTVMEFTEVDDVATTFGTESEEYLRAVLYLGFVSKIITKRRKFHLHIMTQSPAGQRLRLSVVRH